MIVCVPDSVLEQSRSLQSGFAVIAESNAAVAAAAPTLTDPSLIVSSSAALPCTNASLPKGRIVSWYSANGLTQVSTSYDANGHEVGMERTTVGLAPCPRTQYACSANVAYSNRTPQRLVTTNTVLFPSEHSWSTRSSSSVCDAHPTCSSALALEGRITYFLTPAWFRSHL